MPQEQELVPEGILDNIKDLVFRTVIFSQKDRIRDMVLTIVYKTHEYTASWVIDQWDAIFDKLASMMGLTLVPNDGSSGDGIDRYQCEFDPNAELVPESGETPENIMAFVMWLLPIIMKLWI